MTEQQQMVLEFTKTFDLDWSDTPITPSPSVIRLRIRLIREELDELEKAYKNRNLIDVADALGDLLYVIYGTAIACGIVLSQEIYYTEERKSLSPSFLQKIFDYRSEAILSKFDNILTLIDLHLAFSDLKITTNHLCNFRKGLYTVSSMFGLDLDTIFAEIHRSNMSKVWKEYPVVEEGVSITAIPGGWKVQRNDGKLLKSKNFSPPALDVLLMNSNSSQ